MRDYICCVASVELSKSVSLSSSLSYFFRSLGSIEYYNVRSYMRKYLTPKIVKRRKWRYVACFAFLLVQTILYMLVFHSIHFTSLLKLETRAPIPLLNRGLMYRFSPISLINRPLYAKSSLTKLENATLAKLSLRRLLERHPRRIDRCRTYSFHAVDWTLYRKAPFDETKESVKCRKLHATIFKEKLVKWIIHRNGTRTNLGCTRFTAMCAEGPHFDTKRNIRINMPPCCREKIMAVVKTVTRDLNRLHIPYVLFGGAVLGWLRNRKFVPYDQDVDIWMDGRFWDKKQFNELRRNWTTKFGLYTSYQDNRYKLWTFYSSSNRQGLDIFPWYTDPRRYGAGRMVRLADIFQGKGTMSFKTVFPRRRVRMEGVDTFIPNKPYEYCRKEYGKNWREEMNCTKINADKKCLA